MNREIPTFNLKQSASICCCTSLALHVIIQGYRSGTHLLTATGGQRIAPLGQFFFSRIRPADASGEAARPAP